MNVLIARYPVEAHWLNFPYFYEKANRELGAFAEVDDVVLRDPGRPIGENLDLSPYSGVVSFGGRFTEACVQKAARLKIVAGFQCGEDVLQKRGIRFVELSGGWARSVAELGIGLTLCCLRHIAHWHARIETNHETWHRQQFTDDPSFVNGELCGKRAGIFGFGRIGQRYARLAAAFGAELAATDPLTPDEVYKEIGAQKMALDDLLTWSDIFVVCSSSTPESKGLIDRNRLYKLRKGSALIIISRSWPLDMQAVRDRVAAGEICGASDVFDREPMAPNDVLRRSPNFTCTPHVAGRCADSNRLMAEMTVNAFRETLGA